MREIWLSDLVGTPDLHSAKELLQIKRVAVKLISMDVGGVAIMKCLSSCCATVFDSVSAFCVQRCTLGCICEAGCDI